MAHNNLFLNPFSADSAHHRPIGSGAEYAGGSHPATMDWLQASSFAVNSATQHFGTWIQEATEFDPQKTVTWNGKNNGKNLPTTTNIPNGLSETASNPGGDRDNHVVLYHHSTGIAREFFKFDWNGGAPEAAVLHSHKFNGLGHGTSLGQRVGNTAAGISTAFGVLRGFEINTPGYNLGHALHIAIPGQTTVGTNTCNMMLSKDIILPATARDTAASRPDRSTGNIPYGALLALPPDVNINSLGLSEPGKRLAQAIQDYGIYVVDTGGCARGAIRADQDILLSIRNQLADDIRKIYPLIRMVLNSAWLPGQEAVGGGEPRAANTAFDAGSPPPPPPPSEAAMPTLLNVVAFGLEEV